MVRQEPPNVSSVITGASRVEQVRENARAVELVPKLTPEVMATVETILGGDRVRGENARP